MPALRPTWRPSVARRYRQPGGPWEGPTLDQLLSAPAPGAPGAATHLLVADGHRLTHQVTEELVARLAGGLRRRGVRRGHVVAFQLRNGLAAALVLRACWRIGAVAAPVLHSLGPAETRAALEQVDPVVCLELPARATTEPDDLLEALGGTPVPAAASAARPSDLAVVLFTSGSTGVPKAVLHTHRALSWKARLMAAVHNLSPADAVLMPAPLAHISGLLNGVLLPGAAKMTSVLVRRFDPEEALCLIEAERVSFLAGPPTFFVAMAAASQQRPVDTSSMRLISSGGAAVTPAFVEATAATFGCRVKRTYGSTEAPTVTTSTHDDPFDRARDTEGRAVGRVELRISDPATAKALPQGQEGELWVRGPELFAGYASPEQTASVTARGGWFRTGDLAVVEEGWLTVVGRLKDIIIRGGENISASEVEGIAEACPGVRQAVAVGYPDPLMGERLALFVVSEAPFDLARCQEWFTAQEVARFKTPERVVRVDQLPLLGTGKPDRGALKALAADHRASS